MASGKAIHGQNQIINKEKETELDSKTVWLKLPCSSAAGHKENQAGTELEPSFLLISVHCVAIEFDSAIPY